MPDHSSLPGWPRGMQVDLAAAYVGISTSAFLTAVAAGDAPAAVWVIKRRKIWLKEDLDAFLDAKAGREAPLPEVNPLDALLDARRAAAPHS